MGYYRDTYLHSDHWKTLRSIKLRRKHAECELCKIKSLSNDVHHLKYRHLYDVDPKKELMVLCRDCLNRVNELLKKCPKMRTIEPAVHLRGVIKKHLKQKIITVNPSDEEAFLEAIKQRDIKRVVKQKNRDNEYRMRMFGQIGRAHV